MENLNLEGKSKDNNDWWDEISQEEKSSIEKDLADIKAGRVIPHSKVKKIYAKWLNL